MAEQLRDELYQGHKILKPQHIKQLIEICDIRITQLNWRLQDIEEKELRLESSVARESLRHLKGNTLRLIAEAEILKTELTSYQNTYYRP